MPVGEQQALITQIVSNVLDAPIGFGGFYWLINQHRQQDFQQYYSLIDNIFRALGGNPNSGKGIEGLNCDAYFGDSFNFILEFDEHQHFSTSRLKTLESYPSDLQVGFSVEEYKGYCQQYCFGADKYRYSKKTKDFKFPGGRTAQRAYLDCFRDILPPLHGLKPTVRIAQFEVLDITSNNPKSQDNIRQLLIRKGVL